MENVICNTLTILYKNYFARVENGVTIVFLLQIEYICCHMKNADVLVVHASETIAKLAEEALRKNNHHVVGAEHTYPALVERLDRLRKEQQPVQVVLLGESIPSAPGSPAMSGHDVESYLIQQLGSQVIIVALYDQLNAAKFGDVPFLFGDVPFLKESIYAGLGSFIDELQINRSAFLARTLRE